MPTKQADETKIYYQKPGALLSLITQKERARCALLAQRDLAKQIEATPNARQFGKSGWQAVVKK